MPGDNQLAHATQAERLRPALRNKDTFDDVTCTKSVDGRIEISTPLILDSGNLTETKWGVDSGGKLLAASILYGFLLHEDLKNDLRNNLAELDIALADDACTSAQAIIGPYLADILALFTDELIATLPLGVGIIPCDGIRDWICRNVDGMPTLGNDLVFDENADCYAVGDIQDVSHLPFNTHGFVCGRAKSMIPRYNIAQRVWLNRQITMDWQGPPIVCESLAANVIDRFIDVQPSKTPLRQRINGQEDAFYSPFAEDFISELPPNGGQIPVSVIGKWFSRHL